MPERKRFFLQLRSSLIWCCWSWKWPWHRYCFSFSWDWFLFCTCVFLCIRSLYIRFHKQFWVSLVFSLYLLYSLWTLSKQHEFRINLLDISCFEFVYFYHFLQMVVFDNFFADCPSGQLYLNFSFSKFSKHFSLKEDNISATPCWSWQHLVCKLWLWIMFCKFSFLLTSSAKCRFGHFFVSCRCGSFFVANLLLWRSRGRWLH